MLYLIYYLDIIMLKRYYLFIFVIIINIMQIMRTLKTLYIIILNDIILLLFLFKLIFDLKIL